MKHKERVSLVTTLVICILVILFTQFSSLAENVKLAALFPTLGTIFGSVLNYFSKEDQR
ncbi:hypothetical protein [Vagococcus salmoninarum]|uniref:hypothetical protein n=1 Tax=Vagococcus salmoninarum TaxID=2739 RepID=UPI0028D668D5|nr:hypothetical protein [Vagococcus salmoninarum]